jgi:hypothetical protein
MMVSPSMLAATVTNEAAIRLYLSAGSGNRKTLSLRPAWMRFRPLKS